MKSKSYCVQPDSLIQAVTTKEDHSGLSKPWLVMARDQYLSTVGKIVRHIISSIKICFTKLIMGYSQIKMF